MQHIRARSGSGMLSNDRVRRPDAGRRAKEALLLRLPAVVAPLVLAACISQSKGAPGQAGPILDSALEKPVAWFATDEARVLGDNIASWQNANGGWWKTYDPNTTKPAALPEPAHNDGAPGDTEADWRRTSTIDNGATYSEIGLLGRIYDAQHREPHKTSFERGLKFLFDAQYPSGGWPQRFPLENNYGRHITFNDDAMVNVLRLMRDVADGKFAFVDETTRRRAREAFDRGIDCILDCQIRTNGKMTAWCQQHDATTLAPIGARTFELPSISGNESAGIVLLLMELPDPNERVRASIEAAITWYDASKITGKRVEKVTGAAYENGQDRRLIDDPAAPPLWARFYDIETNKPFFASRDGVKRWDYAEISWERRNKYSWYGNWGSKALGAYQSWKDRPHAAEPH